MWVELLVFALVVLFLLRRQFNYWKDRGVPGPKPLFLVGNFGRFILGKSSIGDILDEIYSQYEDHAFVGLYRMGTPALLIRDPDFARNIAVKDFKHFAKNEFPIDKKLDPLLGRNAFALSGEEWKRTRTIVTPCFTAMKMKQMYPLLEEVGKRMTEYIKKEMEGKDVALLESKELCTRYTLDNVGLCAFGIESKCFKEENAEFRDLARRFMSPSSSMLVKWTLVTIIPWLINFFTFKFVPKDVDDRLMAIVEHTVKYREENNIRRNDFLDYFLELQKTTDKMTIVDVVAQAAGFFADGFETSSLVMSFFLFEIAQNTEVQQKLRKEINDTLLKNNNELSYESIEEMPYLDACFNESMRKNPLMYFVSKICTERYSYTPNSPDYKNNSITVQPGTIVMLPVKALQLNSKYFPEPEKFIPERHLNKDENVTKYFTPFGQGARSCLGKRFGSYQIKAGVVQILKQFEISLNKKTQLPLKYDFWYFMLLPVGGLWLEFRKLTAK